MQKLSLSGYDAPEPYSRDLTGRNNVKVALCRLGLHLHILHKHSGYVHHVIHESRFVHTIMQDICMQTVWLYPVMKVPVPICECIIVYVHTF